MKPGFCSFVSAKYFDKNIPFKIYRNELELGNTSGISGCQMVGGITRPQYLSNRGDEEEPPFLKVVNLNYDAKVDSNFLQGQRLNLT